MNAVGTNTADRTSAMAISAPPTSSIVRARRVSRRHPLVEIALHVLHHHDRIVDDDADGEHEPEERERVQREAERLEHRERADERHGNGERAE